MKRHLFYLSMALITRCSQHVVMARRVCFTPTSSGRAYEILVVVDKGCGSVRQEGPFGTIPMYRGLPQSERYFEDNDSKCAYIEVDR